MVTQSVGGRAHAERGHQAGAGRAHAERGHQTRVRPRSDAPRRNAGVTLRVPSRQHGDAERGHQAGAGRAHAERGHQAGAGRAHAERGHEAGKQWSLVDAASLMQERGLVEALTTDHNFEQAKFNRLLAS